MNQKITTNSNLIDIFPDKNDPNPFMTQKPEKLYQQLDYDKDTMFGYTSAVCLH